MARKKVPDVLTITPEDVAEAAEKNRRVLQTALKSTSDKNLIDFVKANALALGKVLLPESPDSLKDYIDNPTTKQLRAKIIPAIKQMSDEDVLGLQTKLVVSAKKLSTPDSIAEKHHNEAQRRAAFNQRGRDLFASAAKDIQKGTSGLVSLLTLGTSIRSLPTVMFGSAARLSVLPAAKAVAGVLAYSKVSRLKALGAGVSTAAVLGTIGSIDMVDSSPYLAMMATPDMMQESCNINPGALSSAANAAYATNADLFKASGGDLAKSVMLHGAQHGVPAIALHYISYLETGKFRDVVANNSSADGLFQMTDPTKLAYLIEYGQKTSFYLEAQNNINNGVASDQERLLVRAIDTVVNADKDALNDLLKSKALDPLLHKALIAASDPYMQAELVAMDMAKNAPELTKPGLSNEEILAATESYYAEHHFLGMTTFRKLEELAKTNPANPIGKEFKSIVEANPGLLKADMTAGQAIDSIKASFASYVQKPFTAFGSSYDVHASAGQICLTKEAAAFLPDKISLGKVALMESGLYREFMQAQEFFTAAADKLKALQGTVSKPLSETLISEGIDKALNEALSEDKALSTSIRPKPRPDRKLEVSEETSTSAITKSARPLPRPSPKT